MCTPHRRAPRQLPARTWHSGAAGRPAAPRTSEYCLTLDRALQTLADAETFLHDRGMLTRTADCALPNPYQACHKDPLQADSPGSGAWPAAKWPWSGQLAERGYPIAVAPGGARFAARRPERCEYRD